MEKKNEEQVCPSRADSQKRKIVEYIVKNFLNADFFEELYDDPLSFFTDKDRKSDEVGEVSESLNAVDEKSQS